MTQTNILNKTISITAALATVLWPFLVWIGIELGVLYYVLPVLILVFILRLSASARQKTPLRRVTLGVALIAVILFASSMFFEEFGLLLYYPVLVSAVLLAYFFLSLFAGQSAVEMIARLQDPDLDSHGVAYTRGVTKLWCWFFLANGAFALYTCLSGSMALWVVYNGVVSYILIGLLMGAEYVYRRRILRKIYG